MTTTPNVTVSATPMNQWTNPTPAPNLNMGTVNVGSGQVKSVTTPSGVTTPTITTPPAPIVTNSSGTGTVIATSGVSSMLDAKGMVNVQNAEVNNPQLTAEHNNYIASLDAKSAELKTRLADQLASIENSFNNANTSLNKKQLNETGTFSNTLARIGGYLGYGSASMGAIASLNDAHSAQISELEAKRQEALQAARNAVSDKDFEYANLKHQEMVSYEAAIQKSKQDFFNNNKKIIEDQQQSQKDSAIAKLYSDGTTDVASIITSLKGLGIYATADDINKTITSLVPPAISDLVKNLDKYGAPGDVKLKVLNSKNANEAYANAGVWANLGGEGKPGAYNFYVASQKAAGKPYVDYMTFDNQDQILKNEQNKYATYTGGTGVVGNSLGSAIVAQESGGSYTAVNGYKDSDGIPLEQKVADGTKALGKYQMMPFNLPEYAGLENTKENRLKYLQSPEIQDAAFKKMLDELTTKYSGNVDKTLAHYYGGSLGASNVGTPAGDRQGKFDKDGKPTGNPSVNEYVQQVKAKMNPAIEPIGRATNQILGMNKFTEQGRNDFVGSLNAAKTTGDALAILEKQAKDTLSGANQTKLEAQVQTAEVLTSLQDKLNKFYEKGGDTNIFNGTFQNAQNQLLKVEGDPELVSLAVSIESALQVYRNAISGTAYSNQEGQAIASIFPGITKSNGLNKAIIDTRVNDIKKFADDTYTGILGSSYKQIKDLAAKEKMTTGDVLAQKMDQQLTKLTQNYSDPVKKADIDSKISTIESKLGRKISREEFLQAYPSYGN